MFGVWCVKTINLKAYMVSMGFHKTKVNYQFNMFLSTVKCKIQ